jgi:pimeloyl-ACP methyl ester carboxylesterase
MTRTDISFDSGGVACSGWHFPGDGDRFDGPNGRPLVVMGHGLGGTKDSGLEPFADRLSRAGLDVLAFDYRGFGVSEGAPRQTVSLAGQIRDFKSALAAAKRLPGLDPNRVVLWGSSLSGGLVLRVAAGRDDVAAVIAMTPLTRGVAASRAAIAHRDVASALKWTAVGLKSRADVARGHRPTMMPLVAHPGEPGALTLDEAYESYTALAGPTWRNEIDSAVGLQIAGSAPPGPPRRCAAQRCSRSPTSTATYPPTRWPRPPYWPGEWSTTTRATTSTSGRDTTGSRTPPPTRWGSSPGPWSVLRRALIDRKRLSGNRCQLVGDLLRLRDERRRVGFHRAVRAPHR